MSGNRGLRGCLLGQAVGDALGLPMEGLGPSRQARLFPDPGRMQLLPGGWGMISDDTEHAAMTACALLRSGGDPVAFGRDLGWRLRFWLLGLPAGVGLATGRAILKLWLGFPPERSGVWSAGNGPAMRAPILGVARGGEPEHLRELVFRSTRLTHTDPRAGWGALAVALAAALSARHGPRPPAAGELGREFLAAWDGLMGEEGGEMRRLLAGAVASAAAGEGAALHAAALGLERGVSGYVLHTVPVVIQAWLRAGGEFAAPLVEVIRLGGDTDTVAAILGGILGAGVGEEGIPPEWRRGIREWPRSPGWLLRLADALARGAGGTPPRLFWPGVVVRNSGFLVVVLLHGLRRLLPPY